MIPHPLIPVNILRPTDILFLLCIGACFEILTRTASYLVGRRSKREVTIRSDLHALRYGTAQSRRLGPSAFVETSKLERAVLAKEKELDQAETKRKNRMEIVARMNHKVGLVMNILVFALYYGTPILSIDGKRLPLPVEDDDIDKVVTHSERAAGYMGGLLFPLSYVGIGIRLAGIGLPDRASSIGALVPVWAAQATVRKVAECVEALAIR